MSVKNILIFGDSYSTFEGYIPEGYATWYSGEETTKTDVRNVTETWWHQVITEMNANLVLNNSWSGSPIGYTGYDNVDCSSTTSFIYRLRELIQNGFFEKHQVDTVFVFGGTNDSCCGAPLGSQKFSDWEKEDLYSVVPAVCYFMKALRDALPDAEIYCFINVGIKNEICEGMREACKRYHIQTVECTDVDMREGHPTKLGMQRIRDCFFNSL